MVIRAGLSNKHSVHVHMRPHHIGGPTSDQAVVKTVMLKFVIKVY